MGPMHGETEEANAWKDQCREKDSHESSTCRGALEQLLLFYTTYDITNVDCGLELAPGDGGVYL